MSDRSDYRHSGASEFPNDNPLLHDGAIWVCFAPCGPLRPVVRPRTGARASTIPAPPLASAVVVPVAVPPPGPELMLPPPIVPVPVPEPVGAPAPPSPMQRLELELTPVSASEPVLAESLAVEPIEQVGPSGCSLSAGLAPAEEPPRSDAHVSELRARLHHDGVSDVANDEATSSEPQQDAAPAPEGRVCVVENVPPALLPPVDVECTPVPADPTEVAAVIGETGERSTILPPPSEEGVEQTLTLARIRVTGRSIEVVTEIPEAPGLETREQAMVAEASAAEASAVEQSAPMDPFAAFVAAIVEVALAGGATRAAAVLPGLLDGVAQDFSGFSDAIRASVVSGGIVTDDGVALAPSAAFTGTSSAWRAVLRGQSNDFSACGTSTLDAWAADLLKAFGVGRDGRVDVRRELRRRGVAAFGMILAA